MSGIDFLADTNAVLYFLSGNECMKPYISCKYAVSIISEMELLSYPKITEEEAKNVKRFQTHPKDVLQTVHCYLSRMK